MIVNENQLDALVELANIGVSRAATQLSLLLHDTITITIPELHLVPFADAASHIESPDARKIIVYQDLAGGLQGRAHLAFDPVDSKTLVQAMLGTMSDMEHVDMSVYEHEALTEIGNIVLSTCTATLADAIGAELELSTPTYLEQSFQDLFAGYAKKDITHDIVMKASLQVAIHAVEGVLLIVLTLHSISDLLGKMDAYLVKLYVQGSR